MKPTKAGYYWVKRPAEDDDWESWPNPWIVHVTDKGRSGFGDGDGVLAYWLYGLDYQSFLSDAPRDWIWGPGIEQPASI